MELYKKHKLNPFSGIFLLLLQIPVFIAIFRIFRTEITSEIFGNHTLLGLVDLSEASLVMAFVAAGFQYFQVKITSAGQKGGNLSINKKKENQAPININKTMLFIAPILTFFILTKLPSALGVYWITSTVFSIIQQTYINKRLPDLSHQAHEKQDKKEEG